MAGAIALRPRLLPRFGRISDVDQVPVDRILAPGLVILTPQFDKFILDLFLPSLAGLSIRCSLRIRGRCRAVVTAMKSALNRFQFGFQRDHLGPSHETDKIVRQGGAEKRDGRYEAICQFGV